MGFIEDENCYVDCNKCYRCPYYYKTFDGKSTNTKCTYSKFK